MNPSFPIRDFAVVVAEGDSNIVVPLNLEMWNRARRFVEAGLKQNLNLIQEVYDQYHEFRRKISKIVVFAQYEPDLYQTPSPTSSPFLPLPLKSFKMTYVTTASELVSIIDQKLQLPSFKRASPDTITPLAIEVAPDFGNVIYYAKEDKVQRWMGPHDRTSTQKQFDVTKSEIIVHSSDVHHHWVRIAVLGGAPLNAVPIGQDEHGKPIWRLVPRIAMDTTWAKMLREKRSQP
ncbi:hypothetical protein BC830DRAFT_1166806 [Chytriomyces sp. MP71]|nr:hypothetical protein BC830DRAFT_1166806 [Chytriomyces sp. MP71]